jgi:hypothetical protein
MARLPSAVGWGAALMLAACAGQTRFVETWRGPDAEPQVVQRGDTVVALVLGPDESAQRSAELALTGELSRRGMSAVRGHTLVAGDEAEDPARALPRIKECGATAVIVMRTLGVHTEARDVRPVFIGPGADTGGIRSGFGPYYLHGRGKGGPGEDDQMVRVETLLFDLRRDMLLWTGKSETTGSRALSALMGDLIDAVAAEMARQGVIPPLKS